jgi:heme A synthase
MPLNEVHANLANTALYYFVVLSIWGYFRFFRKEGISSGFWGAIVIAEILLILQSVLGGWLWISGLRPARGVHLLYGIVAPMALPMVYMYTRGRQKRPEMLMYGTACLITIGLVLRATSTGQFAP